MASQHKTEEVGIAEAKANFTRIVRELQKKRQPIAITHRGRRVAVLTLPDEDDEDSLAGFLFPGKVEIKGDIVAPALPVSDWKAAR